MDTYSFEKFKAECEAQGIEIIKTNLSDMLSGDPDDYDETRRLGFGKDSFRTEDIRYLMKRMEKEYSIKIIAFEAKDDELFVGDNGAALMLHGDDTFNALISD